MNRKLGKYVRIAVVYCICAGLLTSAAFSETMDGPALLAAQEEAFTEPLTDGSPDAFSPDESADGLSFEALSGESADDLQGGMPDLIETDPGTEEEPAGDPADSPDTETLDTIEGVYDSGEDFGEDLLIEDFEIQDQEDEYMDPEDEYPDSEEEMLESVEEYVTEAEESLAEADTEAEVSEEIGEEGLLMTTGAVEHKVNGSWLLDSYYKTSELIELGCANDILRTRKTDLTIEVDQDMTIEALACDQEGFQTDLKITGTKTLTVMSDGRCRKYGKLNGSDCYYYPCIEASWISISGSPTIKADISLSSEYYPNGYLAQMMMLWAHDSLSISGGTFLLGTQDSGHYGILAENDITIKGGTIKAFGTSGITSEAGSVIIDNGTIDCTYENASNGITANQNVVINGGNLKFVCQSDSIQAVKKLIINGGTVTAESKNYTLQGFEGVEINGGTVTATNIGAGDAKNRSAICVARGSFIMKGGTVKASSAGYSGHGICVGLNGYPDYSSLSVLGGTLTAAGGKNTAHPFSGIFVGGPVFISGGDVTCSGATCGLSACLNASDNLSMSGGVLDATGDQQAVLFGTEPSVAVALSYLDPVGGKKGTVTSGGTTRYSFLKPDGTAARHVLIGKGCTVTFNANGHGKSPAKQTVASGRCASKPSNPTDASYVFGGWFTDAACSKAYNFASPVTANLTLYAKWTLTTKITGDIKPGAPVAASAVEKVILGRTSDADMKGATFSLLKLKGTAKSRTSIKLSWSKVKGATSYIIYGNKCGRTNKFRKLKKVTGTSWTQSKRKKGTYYKYLVVAVKGNATLAVSKIIHVATQGGKFGNNTGLTLSKTTVAPKKGKTVKVRATAKRGSLPVKSHRGISWESSNPKIATVSKKGVIKGISKGTCYVYAYAQNGISRKVKVTVK